MIDMRSPMGTTVGKGRMVSPKGGDRRTGENAVADYCTTLRQGHCTASGNLTIGENAVTRGRRFCRPRSGSTVQQEALDAETVRCAEWRGSRTERGSGISADVEALSLIVVCTSHQSNDQLGSCIYIHDALDRKLHLDTSPDHHPKTPRI